MSNPINKRQWRVLKFLIDLFNKFKIKYFIDDGLAAIFYGSKRKLYDIDIVLDNKSMNKIKKIFNDISSRPYTYKKFQDCHVYLITIKINKVPIDLVNEKKLYICHEGYGKKKCISLHKRFKETKLVKCKGLKIRVINPENLIVMKLYINRKCDREDARAMIKHKKLNKKKLIKLAKQYGINQKITRLL